MHAASTTHAATGLARLPWWLLGGAALAAAGVFVFGTIRRLAYPHELEWMEGALVDHCRRVATGLPLYCEPTPEHVPFLYAPLQSWLGGAALWLGLDGLFALRLLAAAATAGCAWLLAHWVRRETGHGSAAAVTAGVFLAGYGWCSWWYDLARNDTLFLLPTLGAAFVLRHGGPRRWLPAAALATLAVLAKQSALMWLPAIGVAGCCHDWRTGLRFAAAATAAIAAALGLLHVTTDGWSTFFLFEMPGYHAWQPDYLLDFWRRDMVPLLPLVALALGGFVLQWRRRDRGAALFLAAVGSGGLLTSWLSRLHLGGFDNVLMYAFLAACLLGGIAAADRGPVMRRVGPALLALQFGCLAAEAWPRRGQWLPSAAHRRAHEELAAFVAAQPGPVWIPGHGGITAAAGKGAWAHGMAMFDLAQLTIPEHEPRLSARARRAIEALGDGTLLALRARRFAAVVVDEVGTAPFLTLFAHALDGADGRRGTDDDPYVWLPGPLLREPAAIRPLVGYEVHSPRALVPRR